MTNDFIGNRMAGHELGMWMPGIKKGNGKGGAEGKVCPQFSPFGIGSGFRLFYLSVTLYFTNL